MNVSKLPARRIGRSRETQTKEFDQAMNEFGSTVFENNRRDSIRTVSFPRIKAREGMENVIMKNFDFRDEIESRVSSKDFSEEFSLRERRNSCGAIWLK